MRKNNLNKLMTLTTLGLFALNFTPVLAQVMEIDVLGGGYRLINPATLQFTDVAASFAAQEAILDIRNSNAQDEEEQAATEGLDYLLIEDQNGGNAFDVSVSATNLTDATVEPNISFPVSSFYVKNSNGTGADIVTDNTVTDLMDVSLHSSTDDFVTLETGRILFSSGGRAPGAWRIFPVFKIVIPAATIPGNYKSTVTFTIT